MVVKCVERFAIPPGVSPISERRILDDCGSAWWTEPEYFPDRRGKCLCRGATDGPYFPQ